MPESSNSERIGTASSPGSHPGHPTPVTQDTSLFRNVPSPEGSLSGDAGLPPPAPALGATGPGGETAPTVESIRVGLPLAAPSLEFLGHIDAFLRTHYSDEVARLIAERRDTLDVDLSNMQTAEPELYESVLRCPDLLIHFDAVLRQIGLEQLEMQEVRARDELERRLREQILQQGHADPGLQYRHRELSGTYRRLAAELRLRVAPVNLPVDGMPGLRELSPKNCDALVCIQGMVSSVSGRAPTMVSACFCCTRCQARARAHLHRGHIAQPECCAHCNASGTLELEHQRCRFVDRRTIKIQEAPDQLPSGVPPAACSIVAYDRDLGTLSPGDRVSVVGIYRLRLERAMQTQSTCKAYLRPVVELLSLRILRSAAPEDSHKEAPDPLEEPESFDEYVRERFGAMIPETDDPNDPRLRKLVTSIAPSIFGPTYEKIKLGLLLQCFGGVPKPNCRPQIHILLVGDPGLAKSKLLQFVADTSPRSVYASGKGSSQAGLTATVSRNPDTREFVLEPGALLLADRGICCLDEFDKSSDDVRSSLHEVMESGRLSVAKAGVVANLHARTSILAAANPVESKYNTRKTVVQNINLPASLLSRFDLIYLLLDDRTDEAADAQLAAWLVGLYTGNASRVTSPLPTDAFWAPARLREYIHHAQRLCPVLSPEAQTALVASYERLREDSYGGTGRVVATPRQLASLIRLAEARARARFSRTVTATDVSAALGLMIEAMHLAFTNAQGYLDLSGLDTVTQRARVQGLSQSLHRYLVGLMAQNTSEERAVSIPLPELFQRTKEVLDPTTTLVEFGQAVDLLTSEARVLRVRLGSEDVIVLSANPM
ncbi:DNA replication licensing factor MCM4 [Giardia muris]|uniref:DNA replication licensing factor MCM4 n=1 Tax=Giardia muris TaxID=5742 RepID=A0A4Z1SY47_GIAMU|nr:DNA replication licensing factor MCM4 [Giardia muris]|eukprot:TNJ26603.1 DNA replication licensing factor MCM4 [Giardia muris]